MPELVDVEPGSPEWLAARREGVTATDIPVICGLTAGNTPWALWHQKRGILPDTPDSDRFRLGRFLEPYICEQWRLANTVSFDNLTDGGTSYRSNERPWQMATIDRGLVTEDALEPVELKSWADADRPRWDDGPPPAVRAQVLWQMDVMGVGRGHVACLFLPSGELRSYVIEHDHPEWRDERTGLMSGAGRLACEACKDIDVMRDAGRDFMDLLDLGTPPPVDGSAVTLAALKARWAPVVAPEPCEVDPDLWEKYEEWAEAERSAENLKRGFEALIRDQAGHAGEWTIGGVTVARRLRYPVKAHMRRASMVDKIIRVKVKEDDSEAEG